jgi:hypothetical protein
MTVARIVLRATSRLLGQAGRGDYSRHRRTPRHIEAQVELGNDWLSVDVNSPTFDVPQIECALPRCTERSAGKASKRGADRIDVSGVLGGQPPEADQRIHRGEREVAHEAGPTLRIRTRRCAGQDRPLDEISYRPGNRTPVGVIGFREPA